jgi:hypothetical protein
MVHRISPTDIQQVAYMLAIETVGPHHAIRYEMLTMCLN